MSKQVGVMNKRMFIECKFHVYFMYTCYSNVWWLTRIRVVKKQLSPKVLKMSVVPNSSFFQLLSRC